MKLWKNLVLMSATPFVPLIASAVDQLINITHLEVN